MLSINSQYQSSIRVRLVAALMNYFRRLVTCCVIGMSLTVFGAADEATPDFPVSELERVRTDPDIAVTVDIDAPRAFVFTFLSSHPDDYIPDAVSVEFDHADSQTTGTLDTGSERILTLEDDGFLVQRFLEYDLPAGFTYLTDSERSTVSVPMRYAITRYTLTALNDGRTRLEVAVVYEPDSRFLAFFISRAFRSALNRDLQQAAAIIEAGRQ